MAIKVSLNTTGGNRVSINKQGRSRVRTVALSPSQEFEDLLDVDSSDADDGETIVYDATTGKYVVKVLPNLDGGTF
jgi:hypothetical protein